METKNKQLETLKAKLADDGIVPTSIRQTMKNTFMVSSGFTVVSYYIFNNDDEIIDIQVD